MRDSKNSNASGLGKCATSDLQSGMFTFWFFLNMMKEQNNTKLISIILHSHVYLMHLKINQNDLICMLSHLIFFLYFLPLSLFFIQKQYNKIKLHFL